MKNDIIWRYKNGHPIPIKATNQYMNEKIRKEPQPIEILNDKSEENIIKTLKNYENKIKNDKIENAIVITKTGEVYQVFGDENGVEPNKILKDKLFGAYITHNHTKDRTEYSFSVEDLKMFEEYKLTKLRGVDYKYSYELDGRKSPVLDRITFDNIGEDDTMRHLSSIDYALDKNVYYMRWRNE